MTNRKKIRTALAAGLVLASAVTMTGCARAADTASYNLSRAADEFEVNRRVVFLNGITDSYLLSIEGRCAITDEAGQLEVTCRLGEDQYKKHFLGLSDNVTYFVEQLDATDVSLYHYRVIFKPEAIVPEISMEVGKQ